MKSLKHAGKYFSVIAVFMGGAILGSLATELFQEKAVWLSWSSSFARFYPSVHSPDEGQYIKRIKFVLTQALSGNTIPFFFPASMQDRVMPYFCRACAMARMPSSSRLHLLRRHSVYLIPILRGDNRHSADRKIFIDLIKCCRCPASPAAYNRCAGRPPNMALFP